MEREQFLGRVSAALRGTVLPAVDGPPTAPTIEFDDVVEQFIRAATAVDADVVRVDGADRVAAVVARDMASPQSFIAWDDADSQALALHLDELGWDRIDATVGAESRLADHSRIGSATVGITGVDVGVAATGSLVLAHGPGRPRSASLLVETHIAILHTDRIVSSLDEALARVGWENNSNIVAITGPSRTGDIESILTLGVHGPRHLQIVLVG